MKRQILPLLLVFPAAAWVYACSSDDNGSSSGNPTTPDGGGTDSPVESPDGSKPDGGPTDGGGDGSTNGNPIPASANPQPIASTTSDYIEGPVFYNGSLFAAQVGSPSHLLRIDPGSGNTSEIDNAVVPPFVDTGVTPLGMTIDGKTNSLIRVQSNNAATGGGDIFRFLTDGGVAGQVTPTFDGGTWDSPNDLVVRTSDGQIYVTDPGYQKQAADVNATILNRIYRIDGTTGAVIEAATFPDGDRPNGIAFDKAQTTLYVTTTAGPAQMTGPQLLKYAVNPAGELGAKTVLVANLGADTAPDGIACDDNGNIYVSETAGTAGKVVVYKPDGTSWGSINVAKPATNVAFGGADRKTLYIATTAGVYTLQMNVPGLPQ